MPEICNKLEKESPSRPESPVHALLCFALCTSLLFSDCFYLSVFVSLSSRMNFPINKSSGGPFLTYTTLNSLCPSFLKSAGFLMALNSFLILHSLLIDPKPRHGSHLVSFFLSLSAPIMKCSLKLTVTFQSPS